MLYQFSIGLLVNQMVALWKDSWLDNVLGANAEDESSTSGEKGSIATPSEEPLYQIPEPQNPLGRFLHWILVLSGISLLILAFILSRRKPKVSRR